MRGKKYGARVKFDLNRKKDQSIVDVDDDNTTVMYSVRFMGEVKGS